MVAATISSPESTRALQPPRPPRPPALGSQAAFLTCSQAASGGDAVIRDSFDDDAFGRVIQDQTFRNTLVATLTGLEESFQLKGSHEGSHDRTGPLFCTHHCCSLHPHAMLLFFIREERKPGEPAPAILCKTEEAGASPRGRCSEMVVPSEKSNVFSAFLPPAARFKGKLRGNRCIHTHRSSEPRFSSFTSSSYNLDELQVLYRTPEPDPDHQGAAHRPSGIPTLLNDEAQKRLQQECVCENDSYRCTFLCAASVRV